MQSWIFQGDPKQFKVNEYLQENKEIVWSLNQKHCQDNIRVGDKVCILRSDGGVRGSGGIVAKCTVIALTNNYTTESKYWVKKKNRGTRMVAHLRVDNFNLETKLTRKVLKEDPLLKNKAWVRFPLQTNYHLTALEIVAIKHLWQQHNYPPVTAKGGVSKCTKSPTTKE
jgi:hypothetical protein